MPGRKPRSAAPMTGRCLLARVFAGTFIALFATLAVRSEASTTGALMVWLPLLSVRVASS